MTRSKNVIILTSGLSGSSVVTNLLSTSCGLWKGETTFRKNDYNTHESTKLIEINEQLLKVGHYEGQYTRSFDPDAFQRISNIKSAPIETECIKLLNEFSSHEPWIWKDPRLWVTIGYWNQFFKNIELKFIFLDRDTTQRWISSNLRRQIESISYTKNYNSNIKNQILDFMTINKYDFFKLSYDELIVNPEKTLAELTTFLDCEISIEQLRKVYNGALYKKSRNIKDYFHALLIYLYNYNERLN